MQDKIDEYMTMANYYQLHSDELQVELSALRTKVEGQQDVIEKLEEEAKKRGLLKFTAIEEQKMILNKETLIECIETNKLGSATFFYATGARNFPMQKYDKVYIVGELTCGKLVEMAPTKESGQFSASIAVQPGYKYTFCFKVGDLMTIAAHYPKYLTKIGKCVNYVNVVPEAKKYIGKQHTFIDKSMHHIERKLLEDLYNKVINTGEIPLLKELKNHIGKLYYSTGSLEGIFELRNISIESIIEE